jgi:hypothetical protein
MDTYCDVYRFNWHIISAVTRGLAFHLPVYLQFKSPPLQWYVRIETTFPGGRDPSVMAGKLDPWSLILHPNEQDVPIVLAMVDSIQRCFWSQTTFPWQLIFPSAADTTNNFLVTLRYRGVCDLIIARLLEPNVRFKGRSFTLVSFSWFHHQNLQLLPHLVTKDARFGLVIRFVGLVKL